MTSATNSKETVKLKSLRETRMLRTFRESGPRRTKIFGVRISADD